MSKSKELIKSTLSELKTVFENDTDQFLKDATTIQQLNTTESLKLARLQEKLEAVEKNSKEINEANAILRQFGKHLDDTEKMVDHLEEIARELDGWTRELEAKSKRVS